MKQSLMDLVNVILQRLQDQPDVLPSETGLRRWLVRQGYAKRDIDAAILLVRPRMTQMPHVDETGPGPIRHLSHYERLRLTPEARDALARLDLYELIDPTEREMILERLDQFDGEVGLPELEYLLSWIVCSARDTESQNTIYNAMHAQRMTLH